MMKTIEKQVRETDSWVFSLFDINPLKKHFSVDSLKHVGRFFTYSIDAYRVRGGG